jgi:hypothetical protein
MTETDQADVDRFRTWDGAYVLGALIDEERREYEAHLAQCPECQAAVAEIAMLPSLLARVPDPEIESLGIDGYDADGYGAESQNLDLPLPDSLRQPPSTLLSPPEDMLAKARADHRRGVRRGRVRQVAIGVGSAVVAAAAAIAIVIPLVRNTNNSPTIAPHQNVVAVRQMRPLSNAPIVADFTLIDDGNGQTRIRMKCQYLGGPGPSYSNWYRMVVTSDSGSQEMANRWQVHSGKDVYKPEGVVDIPAARVRSVSITDDAGQPVMIGTV